MKKAADIDSCKSYESFVKYLNYYNRDKELIQGFTYKGKKIKYDLESLLSMQAKIFYCELTDTNEVLWITEDKDENGNDTFLSLNIQELKDMFIKAFSSYEAQLFLLKKDQ